MATTAPHTKPIMTAQASASHGVPIYAPDPVIPCQLSKSGRAGKWAAFVIASGNPPAALMMNGKARYVAIENKKNIIVSLTMTPLAPDKIVNEEYTIHMISKAAAYETPEISDNRRAAPCVTATR